MLQGKHEETIQQEEEVLDDEVANEQEEEDQEVYYTYTLLTHTKKYIYVYIICGH